MHTGGWVDSVTRAALWTVCVCELHDHDCCTSIKGVQVKKTELGDFPWTFLAGGEQGDPKALQVFFIHVLILL